MADVQAGPARDGAAGGVRARPSLVVLDVNETLSDMSPMADRFAEVGAPGHLAAQWFAGVLRDGFALAAVGADEPFATVAAEALRVVLGGRSLDRSLEDAVQHVMDGLSALPVHRDVPAGVRALARAGFRLVTLSNGSASVAEGLLTRAGVREHFEALLSVEDAASWKPAGAAYDVALERCGVRPGDALLVASHPWDIHGATCAGLDTAWIDRDGGHYPTYFEAPGRSVRSLTALAEALAG